MLDEEGLRLGGFGKEDVLGENVAGEVPAGDVPTEAPPGEAPGLGRVLLTGMEGSGAAGGTLREGRDGRGKDAIAHQTWRSWEGFADLSLTVCDAEQTRERLGRKEETKGRSKAPLT